jgi:hypothetical protein
MMQSQGKLSRSALFVVGNFLSRPALSVVLAISSSKSGAFCVESQIRLLQSPKAL